MLWGSHCESRSTDGLQNGAVDGIGRLLLSAVERYRSSAIATLPPAESPDITMFDAGMLMSRRWL